MTVTIGKPLVYPDRPDWDAYFLDIAKAVSRRGECLRSQVGAVLVDKDDRIIATGYNGTEPGTQSCLDGICPRAQNSVPSQAPYHGAGHCVAIHAELNAISDAVRRKLPLQDLKIYLTKAPCPACALILASLVITPVFPLMGP
jgi:dCMP deaminase